MLVPFANRHLAGQCAETGETAQPPTRRERKTWRIPPQLSIQERKLKAKSRPAKKTHGNTFAQIMKFTYEENLINHKLQPRKQ